MSESEWDLDYDVVIAGYGYAGGWAALAAHDEGAKVAIFEKMRHFGGNSILAGGGASCGTDYDGTLAYLEATSAGSTDRSVLEAYASEMCDLEKVMTEFAAEAGFDTVSVRGGGTYPFPGSDQFKVVRFTRNDTYKGFPWVTGGTAGETHFWILHENVTRREIPQYYESPVERLITDADGSVIGVTVRQDGELKRVRARRGVILATGGFEHNARLITHYMHLREAASMSPLGNTGDGVLMAQKAGAALWHMWHVHGSYGFKVPESKIAIRAPFGGYRSHPSSHSAELMPWIAVDKLGNRFMNEWPRAAADTPIRDLEHYDFDQLDYTRIPCYLIFDEEGRKLGPIGVPKFNDESETFRWSADNLAEVEKGYILRRETIQELAAAISVDRAVLSQTVTRWNQACSSSIDADFGRAPDAMMPIRKPPFYAIPAWPIITNTQGGPVHDAEQRIVDPYGEPIGRLYEAGELGAIWGHVYLLSGNIVECIVGGRIAGRHAAQSDPWC
jgi:succinate dehydrogenase/fumarate reductase flavoprotein subunit